MIRNFVSYPKSGRSWIRYILVQLDLETQIHFHHDDFEFNDGFCPPHNFSISKRLGHYSRINKLVYLERDPRDVMVSLYYQVTGRFKDFFGYQDNISAFIRDEYFGAHNLLKFREMWAEIVASRYFHTISYEDCHKDMVAVIRSLLDYYEFYVELHQIQIAIEKAQFDCMKRLEQSDKFPYPWLRLRQGSPKVRSGKIGGFRELLNNEDICYLNSVFKIK